MDSEKNETIRILLVEENKADADLVIKRLKSDELDADIEIITNRMDFVRSIAQNKYDLILCSNSVTDLSGLDALKLSRKIQPQTSVIIIANSCTEQMVIDAMHCGAADYLFKGRLANLSNIVRKVAGGQLYS